MRDERSATFLDRAEALLARVEAVADRLADEFDVDVLRTGNVLTLAFDNGHRIVVNTQEAASEVWVAARSRGFHYRWDGAAGVWRDTRSNDEFDAALARLIGAETGTTPTPDP